MALAEADHLKRSFELIISIPDGPLRANFACYGTVINGTASLPLWGGSAVLWLRRLVRTLLHSVRLARVIRRHDIDLVLTNSSVLVAPVFAARLTGVPAIVHVRDVPGSRLASLVFRLHGRLADTIIVIARGLKPFFVSATRAQLVQIPDGIELPEQGVDTNAPRSLSITSSSPIRLCLVGGIDSRKGQDIAVEALAVLKERRVAALLEFVGREINPEFAARVRQLAEQLGVAAHVNFVGELADVGAHLRGVDIVVAPSRQEWTPLVLMEALALQKPVVAANVGGVAEVIADHSTGLLVSAGDPRALADAIVELASDPVAAAAMALNGRRFVERRFSIAATLEAVEDEIRHFFPQAKPIRRGDD